MSRVGGQLELNNLRDIPIGSRKTYFHSILFLSFHFQVFLFLKSCVLSAVLIWGHAIYHGQHPAEFCVAFPPASSAMNKTSQRRVTALTPEMTF